MRKQENLYNEDVSPKTALSADTDAEQKYKLIYDELNHGVNFTDGVFYLFGEINETSLFHVMTSIRGITNKRKVDGKDISDPITMIINSPGGDVLEMFGIIDYIRSLPCKINTICRGQACSAAAVILTAGTGFRAASNHSTIMMHQASTMQSGKMSDVKSGVQHINKLEEMTNKILEEKTKKDSKFWEVQLERDYWINAETALELGIIDKII